MDRDCSKALIVACRNGDTQAFGALVKEYEKPVFNIVFRMLHDYEEARDVTQTVFLKAYEHLGRFDESRKFFSWIYRIAVNESINFLEKRSRTEELAKEPAAEAGRPDDETDSSIRSQRIQSALMAIKPEYRSVIVLKHFLEMNYVEIGVVLDIPEKTVKSRLYSGRQLLKNALRESRLN